MALNKAQKNRKQTYEHLIQMMKIAGYDRQFYEDQIDEYMNYYDDLQELNKRLEYVDETKEYIEIIKEKRQITKEMRNILSFFNFQPDSNIMNAGEDDDEIL